MQALGLLNLRANPVFHRFRRSQLRLKTSISWLLLTVIVTTFVVSLTYIVQTNNPDVSEQAAARNLWLPLLIIQGLILLLKGTGRTAAGLIQDKIDQTLDYQRLTPLPPLQNLVGYLFGLPLLEYAMFALTLPHLAFIVIKGNIPLGTILAVYVALFVCTIFYHMTAIAVGMVMRRWILGYLLSIFAVAFLNLILAPLGSQLGFKFLQYLSVYPVIGEKVAVLMIGSGAGVAFTFADPVPFFRWTLSPLLFTLLLQSALILTFATMAVRRWQKADKHSLSKPYALGILVVFIVLALGNLWPVITRQFLPFAIFGNSNLEQMSDGIAVALPIIYAFAIWLLCVFLFANTVPKHHEYVRGLRRARKLGQKAARPWDDDAAHIPFMSLFIAVALIGYWILVGKMQQAGFMEFLERGNVVDWRLPLVLGLVLLNSLLLLQALEYRGTILTFLLVWLLPIMIAVVSVASVQDLTRLQTIVGSLSPLATLVVAGLLPLGEIATPSEGSEELAAVTTGLRTGIFFLTVQIALLLWRWHRIRRRPA